jgi:hypothetical protein
MTTDFELLRLHLGAHCVIGINPGGCLEAKNALDRLEAVFDRCTERIAVMREEIHELGEPDGG